MSSLSTQLEAILFWKGEPETVSRLANACAKKTEEVEGALTELEGSLVERGLRLMRTDGKVALVTSPETSLVIEEMRKEELSRDLGKAGAETLAVVLYKGPATRSDIEYVRGVNCSSILRSLMIRGLIEKVPSKERERSFVYQPTPELLAHLGVAHTAELPDYDRARSEIETWERAEQTEEQHNE